MASGNEHRTIHLSWARSFLSSISEFSLLRDFMIGSFYNSHITITENIFETLLWINNPPSILTYWQIYWSVKDVLSEKKIFERRHQRMAVTRSGWNMWSFAHSQWLWAEKSFPSSTELPIYIRLQTIRSEALLIRRCISCLICSHTLVLVTIFCKTLPASLFPTIKLAGPLKNSILST